ncbi:unnamed protein product [Orchesella dallaii]|uniref:Gonadotropin-releasing hormone II receptor n=1 Tax=Orchesella dallaii TaxID=48710 RepID=A0ABP1RGG4_9HEXA
MEFNTEFPNISLSFLQQGLPSLDSKLDYSLENPNSPESILTNYFKKMETPSELTEMFKNLNSTSRSCVIAYIILFLIGAPGNLFVFLSVGHHLWKRRLLRASRIKVLIWHLAMADLFVTFVVIPIEVLCCGVSSSSFWEYDEDQKYVGGGLDFGYNICSAADNCVQGSTPSNSNIIPSLFQLPLFSFLQQRGALQPLLTCCHVFCPITRNHCHTRHGLIHDIKKEPRATGYLLRYMLDFETAEKLVDPRIQEALFVTAVSNSCLNPIIYGNYMRGCWRCGVSKRQRVS